MQKITEVEKDEDESLTRDDIPPIILSHSVYMYDALILNSRTYADLVIHDIDDKWGHMNYSGAKTFRETIDGEKAFSRAGSLCHGWSATLAGTYKVTLTNGKTTTEKI